MSKRATVIKRTAIGVAVVAYLGVASVGTALGSAALFQLVHKQIPKDLTLTTTRDAWLATADNPPERKKLYLAIGAPASALFFFVPMFLLMLGPKRRELHGSARFANRMEIQKAGLRSDRGIVLGKYEDKFLTLGGQQSVLLSAPTRSGKGVGIVVPNLLNWPDSVCVVDIKGENFDITAGFSVQSTARRSTAGRRSPRTASRTATTRCRTSAPTRATWSATCCRSLRSSTRRRFAARAPRASSTTRRATCSSGSRSTWSRRPSCRGPSAKCCASPAARASRPRSTCRA